MLYAAAAALLWAVVEGLGALLAVAYHPLQVVWMRYIVHLAILVLAFGPRRRLGLVRTARPGLQVARGLLMLLMPLCFLAGLAVAPPADVAGTFWVAPLLAMVLAGWLLHERVAAWWWGVTLAGWAGSLLLIRPDRVIGPATIPALGMALCLALYVVMTRMLRHESTVTNLVFTAACVLVPLSVAMPWVWRTPTPRALAVMAAIGAVGLGVLYALDRATEFSPVSAVSPLLFAQPIGDLALRVLFGGARIGHAAILGTALVAASWMAALAAAMRPGGVLAEAVSSSEQAGARVT